MAGPLKGVKVVDLSRVLAGPWCGQVLADMGADVIKVEKPQTGDDTRQWGPPFLKDSVGNDTTDAAYFHSANRGKKSIVVDIQTPQGQDIIRKLVAEADVLIENFRVDALKKYGLDYASLRDINPKLIYCSITGFGQTGPYKNRSGYDFMIQGMGGLMSISGHGDSEAGGGPMKTGVAITDLTTGMYAAIGILGALYERNTSGEGQYIDMSLLDVQVSWLANQNMNYLIGGNIPERKGNSHPNIVPYQVFPTKDGHIIITVGNDKQFNSFCGAIDAPQLATDDRFSIARARVENREALVALIETALAKNTSKHWLDVFEQNQVPAGPINNIAEVFADPQVIARNMQFDLPHTVAGSVPQVANPIRYSKSKLEYKTASPTLGQNTDEVLKDMGLSDADITTLRQKNIIE
ncbi:MAG: CoA transferase [Sphingomonadales bacterium]|nr:CoA transferase [Sphingomonadales bacterium]